MINVSGELNPANWHTDPLTSFLAGIGLYIAVLFLIFLQHRYLPYRWTKSRTWMLALVNLELMLVVLTLFFFLGSQRFLAYIPFIGFMQTPLTLLGLALYLGGLLWHYKLMREERPFFQILLIIPFAFPFVLFTLLLDIIQILPFPMLNNILFSDTETIAGSVILLVISFVFMALMLMFLPPVIISVWQCEPLPDSALKDRLHALCARAEFRHAGFKTWTVMNQALTAAIVGIIPQLRYIIFTTRLLHTLSPNAIEAILAHEIGHSYHRHLLIYPFILFGMAVCTGLYSMIFSEAISGWFNLQLVQHPSTFLQLLYPAVTLVPFALIIWLYFRYIFGLFSRLFERQADLHGFRIGVPPEYIIEALDDVGVATGYTHLIPSWHHYSIQERIDFLKACIDDPALIQKHDRRVKRYLFGYFALLLVALTFFITPLFPNVPIFKQANNALESITKTLKRLEASED